MNLDYKLAVEVPFKPGPKWGKKARPQATEPAAQPARIAILMALAIYMDELLRDGHVRDQAELAEIAGVTRPRVTQVMNLLNLAPDLQETLLFLPSEPNMAADRNLRILTAEMDWEKQRQMV
jgi:hypothetical protein